MPILRADLLESRTVATNAAGALRDALAGLGAAVTTAGADADALVHDARAAFGSGGQAALLGSLEMMWDAVAAVAGELLIPNGHSGKVVLIAPEDGAGEHAAAARAAVENLARTLSTEWARYGITTTALTPRSGTAEADLAVLVAFLISGAGDYYSGCRFELGPR